MKAQIKKPNFASQLRDVCYELDGFAYLLRLKGKDYISPMNIEDINYGIARILERMIKRVKRIMRDLEDAEIMAVRSQLGSGDSDSKRSADEGF